MPRIIQRFLLLLFVWLCGSSALAETPAPWRDYTVREHEANRLVLEVQYANDQAERCVLTTGEGTVFPALSEDQSFVWDGEKRELTLQWSSPRLELTLAYEAALSASLWREGTPYEDELVFTYYDAAWNKLDEDRLFILNQLNGLTVEMETLRGSRSQIPQILNEP